MRNGENHLCFKNKCISRNPLVVQWLGLLAFTAVAPSSILGQGTKVPTS